MAGLDKPACVCFGKADVCMSTGSSGFKGTHPGANPNSLKSELWLLPPRAGLEKSLSYTQTPHTRPGWRRPQEPRLGLQNKRSKWRPQHG